MKTFLTFTLFTCLSLLSNAQTYYLFLDTDWQDSPSHKSKICLNIYESKDRQIVWLQNLSLKESVFYNLMYYIDKLPGISTGSLNKSSKGNGKMKLESFDIWAENQNGDTPIIQKSGALKVESLQRQISSFFKTL